MEKINQLYRNIFKKGEVYSGTTSSIGACAKVKLTNGGEVTLEGVNGVLFTGQKVEVIITDFRNNFMYATLTANSCNELGLCGNIKTGKVICGSHNGLIARTDSSQYPCFSPLEIKDWQRDLSPGTTIRYLHSSVHPEKILEVIEIVPETEAAPANQDLLLKPADTTVITEALAKGSVSIRKDIRLGYSYKGFLINDQCRIAHTVCRVLNTIGGENNQNLRVFKIVNIPPDNKKPVEVLLE